MKKKRKRKYKRNPIIALVLGIILVIFIVWYFFFREKPIVVTVVSEINDYNYYLDSNETRIYKKYYRELEKELEDNKIDEENYAKLVSKLFIIDFYTLTNKLTNKDIGGIQFIHSNLQEQFSTSASSAIYKYLKSNLTGNRRQKLPEVNKVEIIGLEKIKYDKSNYIDDSAYKVILKISYVRDYDYPEEVSLILVHENNKLAIIEVK